jgi:hypothetical protein
MWHYIYIFLFTVITKVIYKSKLKSFKDFTYNDFTYNINKCDLHICLLFSVISKVIHKSNVNSYKDITYNAFTYNINKHTYIFIYCYK